MDVKTFSSCFATRWAHICAVRLRESVQMNENSTHIQNNGP